MRSDNVGVVKRFQRATTHRAALTSQQRPRRDGQRFDLRDRTAAANQLLLCAIVAVLFVVGLVGGFIHRPELFALGALLIGLGGIAALAVPWTSIPAGWVAVLPLVDIVAIALMRQADPIGGLGLLWVFPAMWLATLGRAGLITCCVLIPALYWSLIALGPEPVFSFASFLLPLVIIAISSAVYASARRFAAQRDLLDAQAARLAFARSAAVQQEQLVTEVLDTVDFGVVRFSVAATSSTRTTPSDVSADPCPDCTPRARPGCCCRRTARRRSTRTTIRWRGRAAAKASRTRPCGRRMPRGGASR